MINTHMSPIKIEETNMINKRITHGMFSFNSLSISVSNSVSNSCCVISLNILRFIFIAFLEFILIWKVVQINYGSLEGLVHEFMC